MSDKEVVEELPVNVLNIGVLAIIGSFIEHTNMTNKAFEAVISSKRLPANTELKISVIRTPDQVNDSLDALVIPGGETTVLSRFLEVNNFAQVLQRWSRNQMKFTWGTCAGLIIMSNIIENGGRNPITSIGGIDITCVRNGYGRQQESHVVNLDVGTKRLRDAVQENDLCPFSGVFIRAPVIKSVDSDDVAVLGSKRELSSLSADACVGEVLVPVAVAQGNKMATTFHPELTNDIRWHAYFLLQAFERKFVEYRIH